MRALSLIGQKFDRLLVIDEYVKNQRTRLICICDCGSRRDVARWDVVRKDDRRTRSCGCYHREAAAQAKTTHGRSACGVKTRGSTYISWAAMVMRCTNSKFTQYKDYGGRGIMVCERWRSFENFLEDMGERPEKHTLDRIDNNKNYSPENCRWATAREQKLNSSATRFITINGETLALIDWCDRIGASKSTISARINKLGWSPEKAILTPVKPKQSAADTQN